jgi:branched-chain amino acid transport system permease protein
LSQVEFYVVTLGVFACFSAIEAMGFNIQFGVAGIINLAYILLVAVGAYATALATVSPAPPNGVETYVGGWQLPFPINLLFGIAAALAVGALLGVTALLRLRHDYLALTLVALAQGAQIFAGTNTGLFDGVTGFTGVAGPFEGDLSQAAFGWLFLAISLLAVALVYFVISRMTNSPFGRALRSVRDDEVGVAALGKNTWQLRFAAFMIGAGLAGLGGGLTVLYTGGWNSLAWLPTESAILLAAIIVGGRGRNAGALLGAVVIMVGATQASTFLPQIGPAQLLPGLQIAVVGVIVLAFLWWRPEGILAEQKERFPALVSPQITQDEVVGAGVAAVAVGGPQGASDPQGELS